MIIAASFPDALEMIKNLSSVFEYAFLFLRWVLMIMSVLYMAFAILNLYSLTASPTGQVQKMFPSRAQPTIGSAWIQFVVAGLLMLTAMTLLPIATTSSFLSGESSVQYYSVGSYDAGADNLQTAIQNLLSRAFTFVGLLAVWRGFATWWKITNGESEHKFGRVLGFFFFGMLCFNIEFVNALVANSIGFDIFGFLFKTNE